MARTISKGLAPILERLELDRPQVVTLRDVEKICVEESAEEWLPDVMAETTIDATLEELRDKSTATVQRTGYLLQGARPDIANAIFDARPPRSIAHFGRGATLRSCAKWMMADATLPWHPGRLKPLK